MLDTMLYLDGIDLRMAARRDLVYVRRHAAGEEAEYIIPKKVFHQEDRFIEAWVVDDGGYFIDHDAAIFPEDIVRIGEAEKFILTSSWREGAISSRNADVPEEMSDLTSGPAAVV